MISEFKIRQDLRTIEVTPMPPMRRVRHLLKLCREAKLGAMQMAGFGRMFVLAGDGMRAVRFMNASKRLSALNEEMRECAKVWLGTPRPSMTYGYEPRANAYPNWDGTRKEVNA